MLGEHHPGEHPYAIFNSSMLSRASSRDTARAGNLPVDDGRGFPL